MGGKKSITTKSPALKVSKVQVLSELWWCVRIQWQDKKVLMCKYKHPKL